jgi:putative serine protease PepD
MPRRPYLPRVVSLLAVACVAAGGGALLYSVFASNDSPTKTIVRQVTVPSSQPASSESPLSINQIYRQSYRGVVQINVSSETSSPFGGSQQQQAEGSGWVYDANGNIVTNYHVVSGANSVKVTFWNGKTYTASVVGTDPSTDLAVVKVSAPDSQLHPLSLGDSGALVVGDGVVAIGSPFGLSETVTSGIVSALHRQISSQTKFTIPNAIQTDAAINHGNSGGPLLNSTGQVIGVNSQIQSESGDNAGVGFAIPSNIVRSVASQLIAGGKVEHAYLGVQLSANADTAQIAGVNSGTPAAKAGLKKGDVVVSLDGASVSTSDDLAAAISAHKPGDQVTVTYRRGGSLHSVQLTLANRPS